MKTGTDNNAKVKSTDFYDWWDALEFEMKVRDEKSSPVNKSK
jgi:hypothetical protein